MKTIACSLLLFAACTLAPSFRFHDKVMYTDDFYGVCCGYIDKQWDEEYLVVGQCTTDPQTIITQYIKAHRLYLTKECPHVN